MVKMRFTKMQGAGNDYIYINCLRETIRRPAALAVKMADRHFGVGADGLILIAPSRKADARMVMYNADGGRAEMCGNGVRCVAKYLYDHNIRRAPILRIETDCGIKEISVNVSRGRVASARVNMGLPRLSVKDIPAVSGKKSLVLSPLSVGGKRFEITTVNMGNPHCIIYVRNVRNFPVEALGPLIENHRMFPKRTNVEFVEVLSRNRVRQRTWERGSGETLACGTGASAVCVAGVLTGKTGRRLINHLLGGTLTLEWPNSEGPVYLTGPCAEVFEGDFPA
jgi:diaminopimelate epimerase